MDCDNVGPDHEVEVAELLHHQDFERCYAIKHGGLVARRRRLVRKPSHSLQFSPIQCVVWST